MPDRGGLIRRARRAAAFAGAGLGIAFLLVFLLLRAIVAWLIEED